MVKKFHWPTTLEIIQKEAGVLEETRKIRKEVAFSMRFQTIYLSHPLASLNLNLDAAHPPEPPRFVGTVSILEGRMEAVRFALDEHKIRGRASTRTALWTDASVKEGKAGIAVVTKTNPALTNSKWFTQALSVQCELELSSNIVELLAILKAVELAEQYFPPRKVIIFSDCQWALYKVKYPKLVVIDCSPELFRLWNALSEEIARRSALLKSAGIDLHLHWVPAHSKVPGNYLADHAASRAMRWNGREQSL
ncbi:hypothetical protein FQN49_003312 [Arthroderma sp. PD_2]|nr:hypothetical protein FQN49_003312 [Arthroderma sp. PD_2]